MIERQRREEGGSNPSIWIPIDFGMLKRKDDIMNRNGRYILGDMRDIMIEKNY